MEKKSRTLEELKNESMDASIKIKAFMLEEFPKYGDVAIIHALIERLERIHASVEKIDSGDIGLINHFLRKLEEEWNLTRKDMDDKILIETGFLEPVGGPSNEGVPYVLSSKVRDEIYPRSKACLCDMIEFEKTLPKTLATSSGFLAYAYFLIFLHKDIWPKVSIEKQAMIKYLLYNMFEDFKEQGQ